MHIIITAGSTCSRLHFNLNYLNAGIYSYACERLPLSSFPAPLFAHLDFKALAEVVKLYSQMDLLSLSLSLNVFCVDSSYNYRL